MPAAIAGAYYARLLAEAESSGRIGRVPWEPALPVHTAWDLGYSDGTAIWLDASATNTPTRFYTIVSP